MLDRETLLLANAAWMARCMPSARRFRNALADPRGTQEGYLLRTLGRNAESAYGRKHAFAGIRTIQQYQDRVPIVTYEDLSTWMERVAEGEQGVLAAEPVLMLEKTSGSASASKLIPFTRSLLGEFQRAVSAWAYDTYTHERGLFGASAYWSVGTSTGRERTSGGLRVGFGSDVEYLGGLDQLILRQVLQVPPDVARIPDPQANLYATARFLLESPNLGLVSVWSPSFLLVLVETIHRHAEELVSDIALGELTGPSPIPGDVHERLRRRLHPHPRRGRELQEILTGRGGFVPGRLWPGLRLISCWASGASGQFIPRLQGMFPGVEIQGKGLLATEGVVSMPLTGRVGAPVSITSHFFEFVDRDSPASRPRLVDELESGRTYRVLLTTGGGLYRYDLQDAVKVVGAAGLTPCVEFAGKTANVSDMCGEKLNESQVGEVVRGALGRLGVDAGFAMLAPEWGEPPYYVLFLETPADRGRFQEIIRLVEAGLMENHHYAHCRQIGQLGPPRGFRVSRDGAVSFLAGCAALGQKLENIKPCYLHRQQGWRLRFKGEDVDLPCPLQDRSDIIPVASTTTPEYRNEAL